jgi:hypothetical protein
MRLTPGVASYFHTALQKFPLHLLGQTERERLRFFYGVVELYLDLKIIRKSEKIAEKIPVPEVMGWLLEVEVAHDHLRGIVLCQHC